MLVLRTNPTGLDKAIEVFQKGLYRELNWTGHTAYGRCYRNKSDEGYTAEVYTGDGYREVYMDDTVSAVSFFHVGEKIDAEKGLFKAPVAAIFFVNLSRLSTTTDRADDEVRAQVVKYFGSSILSIESGVDNVLREFSGTRRTKVRDYHPWYCFRINFSLIYQYC